MKKLLSFLTISSLLCLCSCDFLRKVAGRPDSEELAVRSARMHAVLQARQDSVNRVIAAREAVVLDSLEAMPAVEQRGLVLRDYFTFGVPQTAVEGRYNLIVGVYRTDKVIGEHYGKASRLGFEPLFIDFEDGTKALCLASSDCLSTVVDVYDAARSAKVCPVNSWIYVRK